MHPVIALAEPEVEDLARAAERFALPGERVAAVLLADPFGRGLVCLCALRAEGAEQLAWVAVDAGGEPLHDEPRIREAAALVETAEEAASVLVADRVADAAARALPLVPAARPALGAALGELREAARRLAPPSGVRVARAGDLDELRDGAQRLAAALALLEPEADALTALLGDRGDDPLEPLARAVQEALGPLREGPPPGRVPAAIEGAVAAVDALADDVVAGLRRPSAPGAAPPPG
jgi:hypothetical protein